MQKELIECDGSSQRFKDEEALNLVVSAAKSLISIIPWVGGVLNSVIGDLQQKRHFERYSEFVNSLFEDLSSRAESLRADKINRDEFLDLFEHALRQAISNRSLDKRNAIKNIITNYSIKESLSLDSAEYIMSILVNLPVQHLVTVIGLNDFPVNGRAIDDEIESMHLQLALKAGVSEEDLDEILLDLHNEGISMSFKSAYETRRGRGGIFYSAKKSYLTRKGLKFIQAINSMDDEAKRES